MLSETRRYQLVFFVFFAAMNGFVVFRNVYFEELGLTGEQMGLLGGVLVLTGVLAQPAWGMAADRFGAGRGVLLVTAAGSGVAVLAYPLARPLAAPFGFLLLATVAFSLFRAPIVPIATAMVLSDGHDYGNIRAWGSIAFGIGSLGIGWLLAVAATELIFYFYAVGMAVLVVILLGVDRPDADLSPDLRREAVKLLGDRRFVLLLLVAVLTGAISRGGAAYFSVYVRAIGESDGITGTAFMLKTTAEAAIFLSVARLKIGYRTLLTVGLATYMVSFSVFALLPVAPAVLAVQFLLGVGLALYVLSVVNLAHEFSPDGLDATAQALLAGIGLGIGQALGELLGGRAMDVVGVVDLYGLFAGGAAVATAVSLGFHRPMLRAAHARLSRANRGT